MKSGIYFCIIVLISLISSISLTKKEIKETLNEKVLLNKTNLEYQQNQQKATTLLINFVENQKIIKNNIEIASENINTIKSKTQYNDDYRNYN